MKSLARKFIIVITILVVWEIVARSNIYPEMLFPPVSAIMKAFITTSLSGELTSKAGTSLSVLGISMVVGISIAIILSVIAMLSKWGYEFLDTVTTILAPLPSIAILPIAILWFGIGWQPIMFVVLHAVVWPMSLNTFSGFRSIPKVYTEVGENMGLRGIKLVTRIQIPAAFPYLLTGLKIAWAYAWRTIVAAEMVFGVAGSSSGLGFFIYKERYALNTPAVFAGMLMVMIIGLLVEEIGFKYIEKKTIKKWGMSV